MATIQIILQAINAASRDINDVADSLVKVDVAQDAVAESARRMTAAELAAAQAAVDVISAYEELRASADDVAVANVNAAEASIGLAAGLGEASRGAVSAATAYARLSDEQLVTANTAVAAMEAERAMSESIAAAAGDAALAAANVRLLTQAEIDAAGGAVRTAFAVRTLDAAELASINSTLAWREALEAAGDAATGAAAKAGLASVSLAALNSRVAAAGVQARNAALGFNFWGGVMNVLNQKIPLWGGLLDGIGPKILTQVSAWHVWADAIIEVIAVWAGAAIAVGAFSVAASDAVNDVIRQVTNMHTVSDATGQSFQALGGNLEQLHNEVRPEVFQIFGDALTVAAQKGGALNTIIMQTGKVLDDLAARAALAIQGSGFSAFTQNAVTDVRLLGAAFGNLFGLIGNLIRMNQGWATALLQVGTDILGVAEKVTSLIIPLGQLLVLGHGFILWVGLGVTAALKFGSVIAGWGESILNAVLHLVMLGQAFVSVAADEGLFAAASAALEAVDPFVWVGLAVGALAGLAFWLSSSKTGVEQWGNAVMQAAQHASTITGSVAELQTGVAQSTATVTAAQNNLAAASAKTATQFGNTRAAAIQNTLALDSATGAVNDAVSVHQQLTGALASVQNRISSLSSTYGGTSNALGLLSAAGITNTQMLDQSAGAWALVKQEVAATYAAYAAMGNQAGVLGNDLAVLNKQATDQYTAIQKLNQGWDAQASAVAGTQSSFDTIAQGFDTMSSSAATFTEKLGELTVKNLPAAKAAIDSLTPAGIALNTAFTQQVSNINALADTWRSAGVSQNMFVQGVAAGIAPLEKYAAGSQEATDQLVSLAEEAGYQGPASLAALNQFLGITSGQLKNTSGDLQTMKNVANQATAQEALLTGAMQAQGQQITGQLIGAINQAILQYNGVQRAAAAYGNALAQYGRQSTQAQTATQNLETALINAGKAAGDSTAQIAAMIAKVLGIPQKVALEIVMNGAGSFTISGGSVVTPNAGGGIHISPGSNLPGGTAGAGGLRRGGVLAGFGGGDRIPAMLEAGETVLPKEATSHPLTRMVGRMFRVPGFQSGGIVQGGDLQVLSGQRAVTDYGTFKTTFETAMIHAMQGAIAGAEKTSAAAAAAAGGGGGEGKAALQAAAAARGWGSGPEWNALNAVEMREAGYSLTAKNPSSGAYGMAQFINGPSEYYAYGGNPNTAVGQATAMLAYIAQRYGDPIAAWAHEQNFGWYRRGGIATFDQGGLLPPGLSIANNQTGSPEMVLPNAVVQGFTMGMQQLHSPLAGLTTATTATATATTALTTAVTALTTATTASAAASTTAAKAAAAKPAAPKTAAQIEQAKITADKANAAMLAAHLKEVQAAIKATPKSDKTALAQEHALETTITKALKSQDAATAKAEAQLKKDLETQDKQTISAMQKQVEAITKLLGTGSASVSQSGLWTKLQADLSSLASAQKALADLTSGKSGGGAAAKTATAVTSSASSLTSINSKISSAEATLTALYAQEKTTDAALKKQPAGSAERKALAAQLTSIFNQIDATYKTISALEAQKKTAGGGSSGGTPASTGSSYTVVVDRKAESDLAQILTELKAENEQLKQIIGVLGKIQTEADPKAQANAIGPAVAAAIKVTGGGKTTRGG
jgi:hypothetical protein